VRRRTSPRQQETPLPLVGLQQEMPGSRVQGWPSAGRTDCSSYTVRNSQVTCTPWYVLSVPWTCARGNGAVRLGDALDGP
jgi:hypothetical protein